MKTSLETPRVVVVGAGVVGLTCAVRLLQAGYQVEVIAADWTDNVSHVAGALWEYPPYRVEPEALSERWSLRSLAVFQQLSTLSLSRKDSTMNAHAAATSHFTEQPGPHEKVNDDVGVCMRRSVFLFPDERPDPLWKDLVVDFTHDKNTILKEPEYSDCQLEVKDAWAYTAPVIDTPVYLAWLLSEITRLGGKTSKKLLNSFDDVAHLADVVVNCTGARGSSLTADRRIQGSQGDLVHVDCPEIAMATAIEFEYGATENAYIIPRGGGVCLLGGTAVPVPSDGNPVPPMQSQVDAIVQRCSTVVPALRNAKVLKVVSGIRPTRKGGIRFEVEERAIPLPRRPRGRSLERVVSDQDAKAKRRTAIATFSRPFRKTSTRIWGPKQRKDDNIVANLDAQFTNSQRRPPKRTSTTAAMTAFASTVRSTSTLIWGPKKRHDDNIVDNVQAQGRKARSRGTSAGRMRRDLHRLPVVHCYGHGGSGVTCSWGAAEDCVRAVTDLCKHNRLGSTSSDRATLYAQHRARTSRL